MMPPGIPVGTVGVDAGKNAALFAAEILSVSDEVLSAKLLKLREDNKKAVIEKDKAIFKKYTD